jgi:hypothetical protein
MDNTQNQYVDLPKIEKLLKGNDVARLLNVSRSFAHLLMQTGHIPTVRLGRSISVRPQDLVECIEKNIHRQMDMKNLLFISESCLSPIYPVHRFRREQQCICISAH